MAEDSISCLTHLASSGGERKYFKMWLTLSLQEIVQVHQVHTEWCFLHHDLFYERKFLNLYL